VKLIIFRHHQRLRMDTYTFGAVVFTLKAIGCSELLVMVMISVEGSVNGAVWMLLLVFAC
jgi:hypothetical protein